MNSQNIKGGKIKIKSLKQIQKSMTNTIAKVGNKINPFSYVADNKHALEMANQTGIATHDYILPSVVAVGKPVADSIASGASTMLTGNPILGKIAMNSLWDNMVDKQGYDPRLNQKSSVLGNVSSTTGKVIAKPVAGMITGAGIQYIISGGSMKVKTIKQMIYNGYHDNELSNIDGYELDPELSGQRVQVYHNPKTSHAVINHRGTKGIQDVITDINMLGRNSKTNKRFQHSKDITDLAKQKYNNSNFTHIGHSLGSELMHQANLNNNTDDLIKYNGVSLPYDILRTQKDNEYKIRTAIDPVSMLEPLHPYQNSKNNLTIPSESYNPLEEHKAHNLERLNPDLEIGRGIIKKSNKSISLKNKTIII